MDVGKDQVRIVDETVEYAVTMMSVDIDIGHPRHTVAVPEVLRGHTAVVENAEPCRPVSGSVMQTDHVRSGIEDAGQDRRIAVVEIASALFRHARDLIDVLRGMKKQEFVDARAARPHVANLGVQFRL